jgi:hypothetical protein
MTAATGTAGNRTSPLVWVGAAVLASLVLLVAFAGQDDASVGSTGDPNGTGRTGLLALRLLIEESGGETSEDAVPTVDHDIAVLALPLYHDVFADFSDEGEDLTVENHAPILQWVSAGGILITGVDVPEGPESAFGFVDEDAEVPRGGCNIERLSNVTAVRALPHSPVEVGPADTFCFGDAEDALVVIRSRGDGAIVRLATSDLMYNQSLDDADNAAMMARLLNLGPERSITFLTGPGLGGAAGGGPVNEDGEPIGTGDDGVFDLVPTTVIALLVGLGGAFLVYALARGKRLGSPVPETLPIELPSSVYTEAVGRQFSRIDGARAESAELLRREFRVAMARRVGLGADASTAELANALAVPTGIPVMELERLLSGPPPADDDGFVDLASDLANARESMAHGRTALVRATKGTSE